MSGFSRVDIERLKTRIRNLEGRLPEVFTTTDLTKALSVIASLKRAALDEMEDDGEIGRREVPTGRRAREELWFIKIEPR